MNANLLSQKLAVFKKLFCINATRVTCQWFQDVISLKTLIRQGRIQGSPRGPEPLFLPKHDVIKCPQTCVVVQGHSHKARKDFMLHSRMHVSQV